MQGRAAHTGAGPTENQGKLLALPCGLARDLDEMGRVGHWIEDDDGLLGKLQAQDSPLAGLQFDDFQYALAAQLVEGAQLGERHTRPEEDLPVVIPEAEPVWVMRGDAADARAYREAHFHRVVERRFVGQPAKCAMVCFLPNALQRGIGVEDSSAARAENVPGHFEEAQPRRMQEGRNHLLLVQATAGGEADGVDARKLLIGAVEHQILDRADRFGIGRAAQGLEESVGFLHGWSIAHSPACRTEARLDAQAATRAGPLTGVAGFLALDDSRWTTPLSIHLGLRMPRPIAMNTIH